MKRSNIFYSVLLAAATGHILYLSNPFASAIAILGILSYLAFDKFQEDKKAIAELILCRGFSDLQISDNFQKFGGTEFAPMSTSTDPSVAVGYAVRKSQTDGALLMRIVTRNNLQRGIVCCLLLFPIFSRPCLYISCKLGYFEGTRTDCLLWFRLGD
jgi:hypothetical protein